LTQLRGREDGRIACHVAIDAVVILDVFSKKTAGDTERGFDELQKRLAAYIGAATGD
jgi:hypothetical protein